MRPLYRRVTLGVGVALVLSLVVVAAQGSDPLVGTWKLNVAASTYSPGPPPKSATRTVEDFGGGVFVSSTKGVNDKGDATWNHIAFRFDGKDYPYAASTTPGTSPTYTTVAFKRVSANVFEASAKVDGKPATGTITTTIAKDGKSFTAKTTGTNAQGLPVNNVTVWDRQ